MQASQVAKSIPDVALETNAHDHSARRQGKTGKIPIFRLLKRVGMSFFMAKYTATKTLMPSVSQKAKTDSIACTGNYKNMAFWMFQGLRIAALAVAMSLPKGAIILTPPKLLESGEEAFEAAWRDAERNILSCLLENASSRLNHPEAGSRKHKLADSGAVLAYPRQLQK